MPKKKNELLNETEKTKEKENDEVVLEPIVLEDEKGQQLTEEEAAMEEARLESLMQSYFINNMVANQMEAQEQEDDEDILVTVDEDGEVVKEETTKTEIVEKEILVDREPVAIMPSIFEEELLIQVIQKHKSRVRRAANEIIEMQNSFYELIEGPALYDNFIDAQRREVNELESLLFVKPVSLHNLKNEKLKSILEKEMREAIRDMFSIVNELK